MNKQFAVINTANAVNEIIIPKFRAFVEEQTKSPEIQEKINAEIRRLESIEDTVSEIQSNVDFELGDSIAIGGLHFFYSEEKKELVTSSSIKYIAENSILNKEGIGYTWNIEDSIRTRILAILSNAGEDDFYKLLALVEDGINFQEFIDAHKGN